MFSTGRSTSRVACLVSTVYSRKIFHLSTSRLSRVPAYRAQQFRLWLMRHSKIPRYGRVVTVGRALARQQDSRNLLCIRGSFTVLDQSFELLDFGSHSVDRYVQINFIRQFALQNGVKSEGIFSDLSSSSVFVSWPWTADCCFILLMIRNAMVRELF
jgi:hypothetical protein